MFVQMTLFGTTNATSSQASADGVSRSGSQDGPTIGPSGPVAAPASRSASQAKAPEQTTLDTSGPSSPSSSASADLQRALGNRLRQRLEGIGSPLYALTWKEWPMQSGPPICALRASARRTSDSGSTGSGWPTPTASLAEKGVRTEEGAIREAMRKHGPDLGAVAALSGWATPATRDWKDTGDLSTSMTRRDGRPRMDTVPRQAFGATANGSPVPTARTGRLNVELPRWLMGYPEEWEEAAREAFAATATPSSPSSQPSSS